MDFKPEYYSKEQPTVASYVTYIILDTSAEMSDSYRSLSHQLCELRCQILFEDILTLNPNKPNDRALAVYRAKSVNLWDDKIADPCKAILNLPGSVEVAIQCAIEDGWWKDPNQCNMKSQIIEKLYNVIYLEASFARKVKPSLGGFIDKPMWFLFSNNNDGHNSDEMISKRKTTMKTAEQLHDEVCLRGINNYTKNELSVICQKIMLASGDRARAIAAGKRYGWWDDSVAEPCQAILKAPGNRAMAIALAKCDGWWDDSVANPCQAIMEAPVLSDQSTAIAYAKRKGWWKEPHVLSKNDIGLGNIPTDNSTIVTPTRDITIKEAWDRLTRAMIDDPEWAWSVQCNIAIPIMDHLQCNHKAANATAAALIKHLFHYDITENKHYQDIVDDSGSMNRDLMKIINQRERIAKSEQDDASTSPYLMNIKLMNKINRQQRRLKLGRVVLPHIRRCQQCGSVAQPPLDITQDLLGAKHMKNNDNSDIFGQMIDLSNSNPSDPIQEQREFDQALKRKELHDHFIIGAYYTHPAYGKLLVTRYSFDNRYFVEFIITDSDNSSSNLQTIKILDEYVCIPQFKLVADPAYNATSSDDSVSVNEYLHCENLKSYFQRKGYFIRKDRSDIVYVLKKKQYVNNKLSFQKINITNKEYEEVLISIADININDFVLITATQITSPQITGHNRITPELISSNPLNLLQQNTIRINDMFRPGLYYQNLEYPECIFTIRDNSYDQLFLFLEMTHIETAYTTAFSVLKTLINFDDFKLLLCDHSKDKREVISHLKDAILPIWLKDSIDNIGQTDSHITTIGSEAVFRNQDLHSSDSESKCQCTETTKSSIRSDRYDEDAISNSIKDMQFFASKVILSEEVNEPSIDDFFKQGVIYRHRQYPIWNHFFVDLRQPEPDKIAFIMCSHPGAPSVSVQFIKDKIDLNDWVIVAKE